MSSLFLELRLHNADVTHHTTLVIRDDFLDADAVGDRCTGRAPRQRNGNQGRVSSVWDFPDADDAPVSERSLGGGFSTIER